MIQISELEAEKLDKYSRMTLRIRQNYTLK